MRVRIREHEGTPIRAEVFITTEQTILPGEVAAVDPGLHTVKEALAFSILEEVREPAPTSKKKRVSKKVAAQPPASEEPDFLS